MQKRFYYIFGGTENRNTEPSSITLSHRDYKKALDTSTHKFLNEISDYEFPEDYNNKDYFHISNLNEEIPIYLDKERCRIEEHSISWQELNKKISELESEKQLMKIRDDSKQKCLDELIQKLQNIRDNQHPTPSPNDIVTLKEKIDWLGYYTRNGREDNKPEIVLLVETIKKQSKPKLALTTTIIHEMFHAYYDYDLGQDENYHPYVEEPLTEYAMLKFVEKLAKKDKKYSKLFDYAKEMVRQKQYSLGIAHYGFGYYLWEYEQKYGASINWIDTFRNAKYKIAESQQEYKNYAAAFEQGIYPFWDEFRQMKLLQVLLNKNK